MEFFGLLLLYNIKIISPSSPWSFVVVVYGYHHHHLVISAVIITIVISFINSYGANHLSDDALRGEERVENISHVFRKLVEGFVFWYCIAALTISSLIVYFCRWFLHSGIVTNETIWDKLMFRRIQKLLGGRVRGVCSGAAPLSTDVLNFMRAILGCYVCTYSPLRFRYVTVLISLDQIDAWIACSFIHLMVIGQFGDILFGTRQSRTHVIMPKYN